MQLLLGWHIVVRVSCENHRLQKFSHGNRSNHLQKVDTQLLLVQVVELGVRQLEASPDIILQVVGNLIGVLQTLWCKCSALHWIEVIGTHALRLQRLSHGIILGEGIHMMLVSNISSLGAYARLHLEHMPVSST